MKISPVIQIVCSIILLGVAACSSSDTSNTPTESSATALPISAETTEMPEPTAENMEKTLYVGSEMVDCEGGAGPQKCLLVKEDESDDYSLFYSSIKGFEWEEGFQYELLVNVSGGETSADSSSLTYTLIEVVAKNPTAIAPQISFLNGDWLLTELVVNGDTLSLPSGVISTLTIADNDISGTTGCNNFNAEASFDRGNLSIGTVATTRKMCPDTIMDFETALLALFENATTFEADRFSIMMSNDDGTQTATYAYITEKTLYVGPETAECSAGAGLQQCLLVKESQDEEYSLFYDSIDGFEWEEGYEYELLVAQTTVVNPPADGSSLRYTLLEEVDKTSAQTGTADTTAPLASFLDGKWLLTELVVNGESMTLPDDTPAILLIDGNSISGTSGCNSFNGQATFDRGQLEIGQVISTLMACPPPLMDNEIALFNLFENATKFEANGTSISISNADESQTATFAFITEKTFYVGAEQVDCVGVGPQKCLLVKESPDADYTNFYDSIAGFTWEEGNEYEIVVAVTNKENVPQDSSAFNYTLIEIRNQQAVATTPLISILNGTWVLSEMTIDGQPAALNQSSLIILTIDDDTIFGKTGCNNFTGNATFSNNQVEVGSLAMTRKACPEDMMLAESNFETIMNGATVYDVTRDSLTISNADGSNSAVFSYGAVAEVFPLESIIDGKWIFGELIIDDETIYLPEGAEAFIQIAGENIFGKLGCNSFIGTANFDRGDISDVSVAMTRKLCVDEMVMQFEENLIEMLESAVSFSTSPGLLELSNEDGSIIGRFTFAQEKTLFVASEKADCMGIAPQKCLQVKEEGDDEYVHLFNNIEGFDWQEGYEYELLVEVSDILNPPMDASSLRYQLVRVIEMDMVSAE